MAKPTWSFKDVLSSVPKTEPPQGLVASVVKKLPIQIAVDASARAQRRVTSASADLMKAEIALEQLRREHAETEALHVSYVEKRIQALRDAEIEFDKAQGHVLCEVRDAGAIDSKYVDFKSMSAIDEQMKGDGK